MRKGECCLFNGNTEDTGEKFKHKNLRFHCKLELKNKGNNLDPKIDSCSPLTIGTCKFCNKELFIRECNKELFIREKILNQNK